jgi:excisionase family DNA binding protein
MEWSHYRSLLEQLETEVSGWSPETCTELLGTLERVRVLAWSQIVKGSAGSLSTQDRGQLLTLPQVAERLAVSETYAYELARQHKLPIVRLGKYIRVPVEEFEKWVMQQVSLERRIDSEPYAFHSAHRRNRPMTGAKGSKKNDCAPSKSQPKKEMGFRPPIMTPSADLNAVEPAATQKEE